MRKFIASCVLLGLFTSCLTSRISLPLEKAQFQHARLGSSEDNWSLTLAEADPANRNERLFIKRIERKGGLLICIKVKNATLSSDTFYPDSIQFSDPAKKNSRFAKIEVVPTDETFRFSNGPAGAILYSVGTVGLIFGIAAGSGWGAELDGALVFGVPFLLAGVLVESVDDKNVNKIATKIIDSRKPVNLQPESEAIAYYILVPINKHAQLGEISISYKNQEWTFSLSRQRRLPPTPSPYDD